MLTDETATLPREGLKGLEKILFELKIAAFYRYKKTVAPTTATLLLHSKCNLNCTMCWRRTDFAAERLTQEEVPVSRWEETIIKLAEMGCRNIKFSGGGEPLLYPGFLKLATLVKSLDMYGVLTTNGILLDKQMKTALDKIGWDEVAISLDGPTEEINNRIRGAGFDRVIKNIAESKGRSFRLYLQTVIQCENSNFLGEMLALVKKLGIDGIKFLPVYNWNSGQTESDIDDKLFCAYEKAKSLNIQTNLSHLTNGGYRLEKATGNCFFPWFYCLVDELGDVKPCCNLAITRDREVSMGNVIKETIRDIWNGKAFNELREQFKKGVFMDACSHCYSGTIDFNHELDVQVSKVHLSNSKNEVGKHEIIERR